MLPTDTRARRLGAGLAFSILLVAPIDAQGSGARSLLQSPSASREVEAGAVVSAALESFEDAVGDLLGTREEQAEAIVPEADALSRERRLELSAAFVEAFSKDSRRSVSELRGDGLLFADEVSQALGALREESLDDLRQTVVAESSGHARPPRSSEYESRWAYRNALLRYVLYERNRWRDWAVLIGAVLTGLILSVGVLKASTWTFGRRGKGRWGELVKDALDSLHGPLNLLLTTGGLWLGFEALWLPSSLYDPVRTGILVLLVAGFFWMTWRLSATVPARVGEWVTPSGESPGPQILEVARKLMRLGLIVLFVFLGVEMIFGADFTALLAGLGIVGLAVTLAAQDTLKDLFAGVTLHVNQPFQLGDLVRYGGYFGKIEEIGFRMTRLRTLDGHLVTVPNARLVSEPVENVGARPHVRRRFHLDLPYDTPLGRIAKAVETVREVVREAGSLDPDEEVQVHFDEFGPHSLKLLVQYYHESGDYWAAKEKATEIDLALVERLRAEGIDFAFPTQTLHVVTKGSLDAVASEESGAESHEEPNQAAPEGR